MLEIDKGKLGSTNGTMAGRGKGRAHAGRSANSGRFGLSRGDADRCKRSHYTQGLGQGRMGPTLITKHKANSMVVNTSRLNDVWYVDSANDLVHLVHTFVPKSVVQDATYTRSDKQRGQRNR